MESEDEPSDSQGDNKPVKVVVTGSRRASRKLLSCDESGRLLIPSATALERSRSKEIAKIFREVITAEYGE